MYWMVTVAPAGTVALAMACGLQDDVDAAPSTATSKAQAVELVTVTVAVCAWTVKLRHANNTAMNDVAKKCFIIVYN